MMVKFKCKHSGNIFQFESEHDIKTMREHSEYEELVTQREEVKEVEEPAKKAGRPKKESIDGDQDGN